MLTVGAAVDANVIINERIREEQRRGRRVIDAVEHGYDEARTAIFDANITNVIAGVLMYYFGSGPMSGFAVVHDDRNRHLGLHRGHRHPDVRRRSGCASGRTSSGSEDAMRLLKLVPDNTNIDFLRWRNVAIVISMLLIAASIALIAVKGLNFGVDFVGGQVIRATFAQPPSLDKLRSRGHRPRPRRSEHPGIRQRRARSRSACRCPRAARTAPTQAASKVRAGARRSTIPASGSTRSRPSRARSRRSWSGTARSRSLLADARHRHLHLDTVRMAVRRRRAVLPVPRRHPHAGLLRADPDRVRPQRRRRAC